ETEARMEEAMEAMESGRYKNISQAARAFNVPYPTFRRRVQGTALPKKLAHINQQLLTPAEERTLVDWMRYLALSARPINKRTIRPKVVEILRAKGRTTKQNTVSRMWIHNFYEKHCADLKTG
ncbi:hypothetical protein K435DRAFT_687213, partial [Dendrothele bispora CBS 962.96]